MTIEINATHDAARRSWVMGADADETDFPIQNLPFGLFDDGRGARGGVALGDRIIDLVKLATTGLLPDAAMGAVTQAAAGASLAPFLACPPSGVSTLRAVLSDLFREGGAGDRRVLEDQLVPMEAVRLLLPLKPSAFTDFCTSIDHIRRMAGGTPPLSAMSLPVAYNGRASSVRASGEPVVRPCGQFEQPPGSKQVRFGPEPLLDFELEFGAWLRGGNALGEPVNVLEAEALLFGCCLVNDWSARGIQFFESMLGPHLGKSFLTTISPWIVTMEALAPFRVAARGRPEGEPAIPGHLADEADRRAGGINVELTAELASAGGAGMRIVRTNLADLYWTIAQMVAHQASNGAPLEAGDLVATGTVSGAGDEARACLAEISLRSGGSVTLPDGSERRMLEDGDTLTLRGRAIVDGYRPIGFGSCAGTILPARVSA